MSDPLTALLLADEVPVDPPAGFADALLDRCLHELRPRRRGLVVALAFVGALVVAGAATATYFATHRSPTTPPPAPTGALTVMETVGAKDMATISAVLDGRLETVWRCPHGIWCGMLSSIAWSPDGRRLAMTLGEIGGRSRYVGLHVVDVATRADHHIGVPAPTKLGCPLPFDIAWSPDSQRLAYACGDDLRRGLTPTTIYTIRRDGTGRRRLQTGTRSAYSPSWSADGTRIAFSTEPYPRLSARCCSNVPVQHLRGRVYSVGVNGSDRVLVARDAAEPAYAPDGRTIAFATTCGVRTVAVGAAPFAEPTCTGVPYTGFPSWSPDGSTIAVASRQGVLLITPGGRVLGNPVKSLQRGAYYLLGGPTWAPRTAVARLLAPGGRPGY